MGDLQRRELVWRYADLAPVVFSNSSLYLEGTMLCTEQWGDVLRPTRCGSPTGPPAGFCLV